MKSLRILPLLLLFPFAAHARAQEDTLPTQALVRPDSKQPVLPTATALTLKLNDRETHLNALTQVSPANTQVALLIDDGLSRSAGIQLNDLRAFANALPPSTELFVGYMDNGRVEPVVPFTTDHADAAAKIRIPTGIPGISASPYFCLSDFVKHWPGDEEGGSPLHKARFVIMLTNGVDPYNGSTSLLNQDSPYVQTAIVDAQRAGVAVSSIYYRDAGFGGGRGSLSGQDYLEQVARGTGGEAYYQGSFNPVSLTPFFKQFQAAIAETYIASFDAPCPRQGPRTPPHPEGRQHRPQVEVAPPRPDPPRQPGIPNHHHPPRPSNQPASIGCPIHRSLTAMGGVPPFRGSKSRQGMTRNQPFLSSRRALLFFLSVQILQHWPKRA